MILRLISEIFKNNYGLLIKLPQSKPNIMRLLINKFYMALELIPRT